MPLSLAQANVLMAAANDHALANGWKIAVAVGRGRPPRRARPHGRRVPARGADRRSEGSRVDDPESVFHGMRLKNGWKASGLPWTYELDRERMALPERETGTLQRGNLHD